MRVHKLYNRSRTHSHKRSKPNVMSGSSVDDSLADIQANTGAIGQSPVAPLGGNIGKLHKMLDGLSLNTTRSKTTPKKKFHLTL